MGLITRQIGPNAKGSKLTFSEMDNNLYYLQGLGVSGLTFSANTLTITNPTGGTISVVISTGTSGGSGSSGTSGINGSSGTSGTSGIDGSSGTSGTSGIDGTSGSSGTSGIDGTSGSSGTSGISINNLKVVPSGTTIVLDENIQKFIYGDLIIEGEIILKDNSELVILNGDLILSGGTISGSGQTVLVDLPTFGDISQGTSGINGTSGIDGTSGTSGVDGTSGTSGTSGSGFIWKGEWNPSGYYISDIDVVSDSGGTYIKIGGNGNSGSSPSNDPVRWGLVAQPGTSGTSGIDGTIGSSGTSGINGSSGTSGISGGGAFTGGTVSGSTTFTNGLSANTFSTTTYQNLPSVIQISCSDEVTALVTGTTTTFRMPYNMLLTEVRGSLTTAQVSGSIFTVNVLSGGTTILSTLLTINNNEKTSKALGTTQPVISTPNLIDDSEISVSITQIGNGTARGLKVSLIGNRLN